MNLDTPLMFRVNMFADTMALRLDPRTALSENFREFADDVAQLARKKTRRHIANRMRQRRFQGRDYITLERLFETSARVARTSQRFFDTPSFTFTFMVETSALSFVALLYAMAAIAGSVALGCIAVALHHPLKGEDVSLLQVGNESLRHRQVVLPIALSVILTTRRMLVRLHDRHVENM